MTGASVSLNGIVYSSPIVYCLIHSSIHPRPRLRLIQAFADDDNKLRTPGIEGWTHTPVNP